MHTGTPHQAQSLAEPRISIQLNTSRKLTVAKPAKLPSTFYFTPTFIAVITKAANCILSLARLIQFTASYCYFIRSIILPSMLMFHSKGTFSSGFQIQILYLFIIAFMRATCCPYFIILYLVDNINYEVSYLPVLFSPT